MTDETIDPAARLTRAASSEAVSDLGWRHVLGELRTSVAVGSVARAAEVASRAAIVCGADADGHFLADVRSDRALLALRTFADGSITVRDVELAALISAEIGAMGLRTEPAAGGTAPHAPQLIEIGIDAIDIPAIRPFWKAILGYVDDPGQSGSDIALVDPYRQGPAVWFQQMDAPRPQRNRLHLDISVPHDEAPRRMAAAVEAGGTMIYDAEAPAFWVFADAEGNEACVTTWQGRD